ncbi:MAG: class I SAM-dependent methyltransferase [Candidatus Omnitrophota bacterium]
MRILDIGCGKRKADKAIGIDELTDSDADIVLNLEAFPWPIKSDSFDLIFCRHILEHLDDVVKSMEEIHRISRPGAKVIIEVPHFSHPDAFRDPTHKHYFSFFTIEYFTGNPLYPQYCSARFKILRRDIKATSGINRFLSSRLKPALYEERFSRMFPAYGLYLELEALKGKITREVRI